MNRLSAAKRRKEGFQEEQETGNKRIRVITRARKLREIKGTKEETVQKSVVKEIKKDGSREVDASD
jgi:hypothetical protein